MKHTSSVCYNNPPKIHSLFDSDKKVFDIAPLEKGCHACDLISEDRKYCGKKLHHQKIHNPPKIITIEPFTNGAQYDYHNLIGALFFILVLLFILH